MTNRWGKSGNTDTFYFRGLQITVDSNCSHEIKRHLLLGSKTMTNLDSIFKKQRHHFADKGLYSQSYDFSSGHVRMRVGCKEGWMLKNFDAFQLQCWEDFGESLGLQGDQPVNPKRNQPWIFIGRIGAEAEATVLWPPDTKRWLIGKVSDAGKDWRQEEKGVAEEEMVR